MQQETPAPTEGGSPPRVQPEQDDTADTTAPEEDYPVPPKNVDSTPFYVLSTLFDRLQNERKPEKRKKMLDGWFNVCIKLLVLLRNLIRGALRVKHWRQEKGFDLYPVLRLILPQKDRERAVYGLKEKNLAKIYIKLIPLQRTDADAMRLLNWKKPTEKGVRNLPVCYSIRSLTAYQAISGDFPTVLYEVISKRSSIIEGSLSVDDINEVLDDLSKNMGKS